MGENGMTDNAVQREWIRRVAEATEEEREQWRRDGWRKSQLCQALGLGEDLVATGTTMGSTGLKVEVKDREADNTPSGSAPTGGNRNNDTHSQYHINNASEIENENEDDDSDYSEVDLALPPPTLATTTRARLLTLTQRKRRNTTTRTSPPCPSSPPVKEAVA